MTILVGSLFAFAALQGLDSEGLRHTQPLADSVVLSLSSDRDSYFRGEPVALHVAARNTGNAPVSGYFMMDPRYGDAELYYRPSGGSFSKLSCLVSIRGLTAPRVRTLQPTEEAVADPVVSLTNLEPGQRAFLLSSLGTYEFKVILHDTEDDPNGVLESNVLSLQVTAAPSSEQAAQTAYTPDLAYVGQFQRDRSFLSPAETQAAAVYVGQFPGSRYAAAVKKGLGVSLSYRIRIQRATDEERALYDEFFGQAADHTPPLLSVTAIPASLWPPDHKLVPVKVSVGVKDDTDPNPELKLVSIACDDKCDPASDISDATYGADDREFELRAERSGQAKQGRTYTVMYSATDSSGNTSKATTTVVVPHDQGPGPAPAWSDKGVAYKVGDLVTYQGFTWKCIQAHKSQSDWSPPVTPSLWVRIPASNQWDYPVQYAKGDQVIYNGATYKCLQAHTSQAAWTPPATPALWTKASK